VKNVVITNCHYKVSAKDKLHDMTIKEREKCKSLVAEAKIKQSEGMGNFVYRVRGLPGQMKIVKFRKG